jgi:hypothetical protein
MKLADADVIWVPIHEYNMDAPNLGSVRVEEHLSGWQRTKGDGTGLFRPLVAPFESASGPFC